MSCWVQTAAGNLIAASAVTHLAVRENSLRGSWDVTATAAGIESVFAPCSDKGAAGLTRNRLVLAMGTAATDQGPTIIAWDLETGSVNTGPVNAG